MGMKCGLIKLNLKKSSVKADETSWLPTTQEMPSAGRVTLVAFVESHGIILSHFIPKGRNVTARYYLEEI